MSDTWFTEAGAVGTLNLTWDGGSWYPQSADSDVVCIVDGEIDLSPSESPLEVEVKVSKYTIGTGSDPNHLFISPIESTDQDHQASEADSNVSSSSTDFTETHADESSNTQCSYPKKSLSELTGSGDRVTVEAVVQSISWVRKNDSKAPDLKGRLTDTGCSNYTPFVVQPGVSHPFFEEGVRFVFRGVIDHYYERRDEVQVLVTDETDFTEKEMAWPAKPTQDNSSPKSTSDNRRSSSVTENLHDIASEKIGDEDFTVEQSTEDSIVEEAKKQARDQHRDPAIDPKLNDLDDENSDDPEDDMG